MKFPLYYLSSSRLQKKENFRLFSSKSGCGLSQEEVIYKRSQCNDLTRILLVFSKTGRRREMVPDERWSQPEARLYEKLAASFAFLGPCRRIWSLSPKIPLVSLELDRNTENMFFIFLTGIKIKLLMQ